MRRALVAAMAVVLLVLGAVTSHEPFDGSHWPTPAELRQDLADDGWDWAASTYFWKGGRGGPVVYLGLTSPLSLGVTIDDFWGFGLLSWTEQTQMSWTAFLEVAERLPIAGDTLRAVAEELDEPACDDHPIPGGMVTVDGPGRDEVSHTQVKYITVVQGGETRCDQPPIDDELPATDEPGAVESPAA